MQRLMGDDVVVFVLVEVVDVVAVVEGVVLVASSNTSS